MKIVRTLFGEKPCANGVDCPALYQLEDGNYLVRGYAAPGDVLAQLGLPRLLGVFAHFGKRELAVTVPPAMIEEPHV